MVAAGMFEHNFGDSEFLMLFLLLATLPYAVRRTALDTRLEADGLPADGVVTGAALIDGRPVRLMANLVAQHALIGSQERGRVARPFCWRGKLAVARLIVDDPGVLRDGGVEAAAPEMRLRVLQRDFAVDGQGQRYRARGSVNSVDGIKQGRRPKRAPVRRRVPEAPHRLEVVLRRVALVTIEPVARVG